MPPESLFAAENDGALVRVVLERGIDAPGGLTYRAPKSIGPISVGDRVEAPLGRHDRRATGYVVEVNVDADIDPGRIKALRRHTGVRLPTNLISLARWISGYYCCPLGMALSAMAPGAVKHGVGRRRIAVLSRTGKRPVEKLPPATARVWDAIQSMPDDAFPITPRDLVAATGAPNLGPVNRLVKLGLLEQSERAIVHTAADEPVGETPAPVELTEAQAGIVRSITQGLGEFSAHLLYGVTGSGKTEVYLRVLEHVIERGECAIVLVPEISLTPQTVARFVGRFRDVGVAVLHSGLTASQRHQHWMRIASGDARIAIGARSALFAPFDSARGDRVGLIIVDEEHDGAYKQEDLPRHHARDVALKRAQLEGAAALLGSATPSLESWRNAKAGRYQLHELTERVGGAKLPTVRLVDLTDELREDRTTSTRLAMLGPTLRRAIGATLDGEGQVMLLLNRRGWASYICCPDHRCGWTLTCDACDVTMVYHRSRDLPIGGIVRCHHCLAERKLPGECPVCARRVTTFGAGTQRVEEELARLFPAIAAENEIRRLDGDTMRSAKDYFEALGDFADGRVRVLLGTQMIAKGLDFPGVELVGVINADTAINLPDFRAAERTFQLVSQVAGRAGRRAKQGRVIVQTFNPHHPSIQLAAAHNYKGFAEDELSLRERAALPPATRMARIVVRHERHDQAMRVARSITDALHAMQNQQTRLRVRGPMPCPISRVAGRHRIAIEILAPEASLIQSALTSLRNQGLAKSDAVTASDVDPIALL